MILTGASVDDVFVIVMFTAFTGLAKGESISLISFMQIPISIATGLFFGVVIGIVITLIFEKVPMRNTMKTIVLLSISFLFVALEKISYIPFSGLLAVMSMGATIYKKNIDTAKHLSSKFSKLWVAAEILLFALVGATVDLNYALSSGFSVIIVIFASLIFRMFGVLFCMINTKLSMKEIVFCMIAYMPKATVQAAIGSIPLAMGLSCGNIVLTVAVLAILITAPLGAFAIELTYKKLLFKEGV
jgi:NhaP-type Na+/H+ or K+/H+ antiporter